MGLGRLQRRKKRRKGDANLFYAFTQERDEVKKVAKQLLGRLKDLLVLGWRLKIGARAQVRLAIEDALDDGLLRAYSKEIYETKCTAVFEHVYESYQGRGRAFMLTLPRFVFLEISEVKNSVDALHLLRGLKLAYRKEFFQYGNRALMELEREGKT